MDKLEEMKRRLAREESQLWLAFLPINCKEGVFSLKETSDFMQIVRATLNLVRQLIKKVEAGEQFSTIEWQTLQSTVKEFDSVEEMFLDLLGYYRSHLEKFCAKYHLAMPEDKTHVLTGIADSLTALIEDTGESVSLFQLQEMEYTLNLMATPIETFTQSHSVRALPYLRRIDITDSVVAEIERSYNELFARLNEAISEIQSRLQNSIADDHSQEFEATEFAVIEALKSALGDKMSKIRSSFDQSPFDDLGLYAFVCAMKEKNTVNFSIASPAMFQQQRRNSDSSSEADANAPCFQ
ncbi:MAG TPA: hypothetical protein VI844_00185 [Coxiellaceae bacterium]|nr:hypothetical protein [Coxiellaceae bacterium]